MLRKLLLVEDDRYVCERVLQLIGKKFAVTVAHTRIEMEEQLAQQQFAGVLLDLELGDKTPPLTLFQLAQKSQIKVMIFSNTFSIPTARECLRQGAGGVLSKRDNPDSLLPSIETMLAGATVFNETVSQQLLGSSYIPPISLSKGEAKTLDLLHRVPMPANKDIARILGVVESTVESRVRQLLGKFVAVDRHHLVHQARCQGYEPGPTARSPGVPPSE